MMENPKVSIIIPVYNGSNFMKCAIDCALAQTYENTEIIVVNDGSNDDGKTEAIALSYGEQIRYFSKPNGGVSSALNCGIANMTGDYFAWLSHDDAYSATRIEDAVKLLKSHNLLKRKYIGFTGGYVADVNGAGKILPANRKEPGRTFVRSSSMGLYEVFSRNFPRLQLR